MTKLDEMTTGELWADAEMLFDGIADTVSHRCYQEHSMAGARAIQRDVHKHLAWINIALGEIEARAARAAMDKAELEQVLQRVDEGMTTAADAEFLRELLEKLAPKREKGPFGQKVAR